MPAHCPLALREIHRPLGRRGRGRNQNPARPGKVLASVDPGLCQWKDSGSYPRKEGARMKNAHLRFGWLTYVKSTEKTTTSIKLRLDRFIGEVLPDPPRQAKAHLISVIGGDTQIAGRKKPLRHLIALSEEFASSNISAGSGRTLLASSENGFIWASLAHIHGIPGMPHWADWFAGELDTHKAIIRALGIGCAPVLVKGEKELFLSWLSWGVESGAISL